MKISPSHPQPATLSKRDRALLGTAATLFGACALIGGGLQWAMHAPRTAKPEHRAYWVHPATPQQLEVTLAKGKWLRERFHKWGMAHHADLVALRDAKPEDVGTLRRVMRDLPDDPTQANVGFEDDDLLIDPQHDMLHGYCWNIANAPLAATPNQRADPQVQEQQAKGQTALERLATHNWQTQHDIALGFSSNEGPTHYTLWASGRITETQVPLMPKEDPMLEATETEVMPAYEL